MGKIKDSYRGDPDGCDGWHLKTESFQTEVEVSQRQMIKRKLSQDVAFLSMKPENRRIIERSYLAVKSVISI